MIYLSLFYGHKQLFRVYKFALHLMTFIKGMKAQQYFIIMLELYNVALSIISI